MYSYNVTIQIDLSVHDIWLRWMKEEHIPRVMNTGCFAAHKMYRLMQEDETAGITYTVMYFTENMAEYFRYQKEFAPALRQEALDFFPGKFQSFRSVMKEVS